MGFRCAYQRASKFGRKKNSKIKYINSGSLFILVVDRPFDGNAEMKDENSNDCSLSPVISEQIVGVS